MTAEAKVRARLLLVLLVVALLFFSLALVRAQEPAAATEPDKAAQLLVGKNLFVEKCGKCHDERGDKPLASGPPLNERDLTCEEIERAVRGRLRDRTDDERSAVVAYIQSLLKKKPGLAAERSVETVIPAG